MPRERPPAQLGHTAIMGSSGVGYVEDLDDVIRARLTDVDDQRVVLALERDIYGAIETSDRVRAGRPDDQLSPRCHPWRPSAALPPAWARKLPSGIVVQYDAIPFVEIQPLHDVSASGGVESECVG